MGILWQMQFKTLTIWKMSTFNICAENKLSTALGATEYPHWSYMQLIFLFLSLTFQKSNLLSHRNLKQIKE